MTVLIIVCWLGTYNHASVDVSHTTIVHGPFIYHELVVWRCCLSVLNVVRPEGHEEGADELMIALL
jgi:hypothetical protein